MGGIGIDSRGRPSDRGTSSRSRPTFLPTTAGTTEVPPHIVRQLFEDSQQQQLAHAETVAAPPELLPVQNGTSAAAIAVAAAMATTPLHVAAQPDARPHVAPAAVETARPPPGLEEPLNAAGARVNENRSFNREKQSFDRAFEKFHAYAGHEKTVIAEFGRLPSELRATPIKRERQLEAHFGKLQRARVNVERLKERSHKLGQILQAKDWQISKEGVETTMVSTFLSSGRR